MSNRHLTPAEVVAAWRPAPVSPAEAALRAVMAENPAGNDRVTAALILASREAAEARGELPPTSLASVWDRWQREA